MKYIQLKKMWNWHKQLSDQKEDVEGVLLKRCQYGIEDAAFIDDTKNTHELIEINEGLMMKAKWDERECRRAMLCGRGKELAAPLIARAIGVINQKTGEQNQDG